MVEKRDSRRHSTTSFSESVVVAKTSDKILEVLAFFNRERSQPPSIMIAVLTFLAQKSAMTLSGIFFLFDKTQNTLIQIPYS